MRGNDIELTHLDDILHATVQRLFCIIQIMSAEHSNESISEHVKRIAQDLEDFKRKFAIQFFVSISGGAEEHNVPFAERIIFQLIEGLKNLPCAILTGGTQGGVPEIGTNLARKSGLPTVAIFPKKARKYVLYEKIDLPIETLPPSIGSASFGTETPSFAQLPDYAVIIGGSYGTLAEVSTIMKVNTKRLKDAQEPVYVLPITGSEGVADLIPALVQLAPNLSFCLPEFALYTGEEAARFIRGKQRSEVVC